MSIFVGLPTPYIASQATGADLHNPNKLKLDYKAGFVRTPITVEAWSDHLTGKHRLALFPLLEDDTVRFGGIDIDQYPCDLKAIHASVTKANLPLVVCRTKSGGARLFLFVKEPVPAGEIKMKLEEMQAMIGWSGSEVFPKQARITKEEREKGAVGNALNMPYFNAAETDQWALGDKGQKISAKLFVDLATDKSLSGEQFKAFHPKPEEILEGAPPCLQHLIKQGFPAGSRNKGLFNLAVYARKAFPEGNEWGVKVDQWNTKFMTPPLSTAEVTATQKSAQKKEYFYTCNDDPIKSFCNKALCRQCKFGIGGSGAGLPKLGSLVKLETTPPIWYVDVAETDKRLTLATEDLQNQKYFQIRCMEDLNMMPGGMKQFEWEELVRKLMASATIVEVPKELSPRGEVMDLLEEFCTGRVQGKTMDEILTKKPVLWDHHHYFRLNHFMEFVYQHGVRTTKGKVIMHLRDLNAELNVRVRIREKQVCVTRIPAFNTDETPLPVPEMGSGEPF